MTPDFLRTLANVVLILHAGIAGFVVLGLLLVLLGNWRGWPWVNWWWFRLAHLAAIVIVVLESWAGITCPLTTLESWLRAKAGDVTHNVGFIEYWVGSLLFYSAPTWVFTVAYSVFGAAVAATWWLYPPSKGLKSAKSGSF